MTTHPNAKKYEEGSDKRFVAACERANAKRYKGDDEKFRSACERAKVLPTQRQYRKWLRQQGRAYRHR